MTNEYTPGIYEVISDVKIRREPRIVEFKDEHGRVITNQVGFLKVGMQRAVYSIITIKDNTTWGRVSFYDSAEIAQFVCIKGLNREYMRFMEPLRDMPPESLPVGTGAIMAALQDIREQIKRVHEKLDALNK